MSSKVLGHIALSIGTAAALLAGCGGSQPPMIGAPDALPQSASQALPFAQRNAMAPHSDGPSWMAPDAVSKDLLYVADNNSTVTVYSYPQGVLEGKLKFAQSPGGECVDQNGDVYITDVNKREIVEYAHGAKKPMAILRSPYDPLLGCAVDSTMGNLAVSSFSGGVEIYKHARGKPTTFRDSAFDEYFLCGYDNKGNLFVDGIDQRGSSNYTFEFAELPKDGTALTTITLNQTIGFPGGVQWDGKYIAVGDQVKPVIYQFDIDGLRGTKVGSTRLGHDPYSVFQFFILSQTVIAPNQCLFSCFGNVLYYNYPAGGKPTKKITKGVSFPSGVVVSLAPH